MIGEDVLYLPVGELAQRIRSRELSPLELTRGYLERSEQIGGKLNAYATLTRELALREAGQAEREIRRGKYRGPLHGIPYAAKDLLAARGYPTTWGARPYSGQTFDYDATVITRLREAGAILIGKAAMIELAGGMGYRFASASISGPAKNPWNQECWTCGSSSGSGAIASAALAAFAIGTETWGSVVCPSAYCGVSGLRPTYGRVSRHGAMALSYTMDKIGVMGRAAEDCGLVLARIAGPDPDDATSLADRFVFQSGSSAGLKIGWLVNAWEKVPSEVAKPVDDAIEVLRRHGASVKETRLPEGPWEAAAGTIISVEGASAFDSLIESGRVADLSDPLGKIACYANQQIPAADYLRAMRIRTVLQERIDAVLAGFDVVAAPSLPITASPLSANLETDLAFSDPLGAIGNLCGLPAISVPCGFDSKGLPVGIQFAGRARDDNKVIAAAAALQRHTDWHRRRPPVH
jgi:Asp-tRNA(Asn)/Glu-tRNA(Gln) amidotransferase A subunit family amidase